MWGRLDLVNSVSKAKPNEEERIELCWYVSAMLYLTKFWWLWRLVCNRVGKFCWFILQPVAFCARYFKIIICVLEYIRAIKDFLEHHKMRRVDHFPTFPLCWLSTFWSKLSAQMYVNSDSWPVGSNRMMLDSSVRDCVFSHCCFCFTESGWSYQRRKIQKGNYFFSMFCASCFSVASRHWKHSFTESRTGTCCNSVSFCGQLFFTGSVVHCPSVSSLIKEAASSIVVLLLTEWWMVFLQSSLLRRLNYLLYGQLEELCQVGWSIK